MWKMAAPNDGESWVPEPPLGREVPANPEQTLRALHGPEVNFYHVWTTVHTWAYLFIFLQKLVLPLIIHQSKTHMSARVSKNFIHIILALIPGYPCWLVLESLQVSSSVTSPWLLRSRSWRVAFSGEACLVTDTSAYPTRRACGPCLVVHT